jgi:hypothetical protein
MKKLVALLSVTALLLSFAGCSGSTQNKTYLPGTTFTPGGNASISSPGTVAYTLPTTTTAAAPAVTTASSSPRLIKTFTGSGDKTTALFTTSKSNWYIEYTCNQIENNAAGISFSFFVYPETSSTIYVESVLFVEETGTDTTYIYGEKGTYYFKVSAYNTNWTLKVYE